MYAGSVQKVEGIAMLNPEGLGFVNQLDHVALDAYGASVELSETAYAIEEFTKTLETQLAEQLGDHEHVAADLVIEIQMTFDPEPGTGTASAPTGVR